RKAGKIPYKKTADDKNYGITKNDIFMPGKLMIHRVNTLEKFKLLRKENICFEVDLVYDTIRNFFDVHHPPVSSIRLDIEDYLKEDKRKECFFWFDVKNLKLDNVHQILATLQTLD